MKVLFICLIMLFSFYSHAQTPKKQFTQELIELPTVTPLSTIVSRQENTHKRIKNQAEAIKSVTSKIQSLISLANELGGNDNEFPESSIRKIREYLNINIIINSQYVELSSLYDQLKKEHPNLVFLPLPTINEIMNDPEILFGFQDNIEAELMKSDPERYLATSTASDASKGATTIAAIVFPPIAAVGLPTLADDPTIPDTGGKTDSIVAAVVPPTGTDERITSACTTDDIRKQLYDTFVHQMDRIAELQQEPNLKNAIKTQAETYIQNPETSFLGRYDIEGAELNRLVRFAVDPASETREITRIRYDLGNQGAESQKTENRMLDVPLLKPAIAHTIEEMDIYRTYLLNLHLAFLASRQCATGILPDIIEFHTSELAQHESSEAKIVADQLKAYVANERLNKALSDYSEDSGSAQFCDYISVAPAFALMADGYIKKVEDYIRKGDQPECSIGKLSRFDETLKTVRGHGDDGNPNAMIPYPNIPITEDNINNRFEELKPSDPRFFDDICFTIDKKNNLKLDNCTENPKHLAVMAAKLYELWIRMHIILGSQKSPITPTEQDPTEATTEHTTAALPGDDPPDPAPKTPVKSDPNTEIARTPATLPF